ncbi:hypothetical protein C0995_000203 [Termitomyces sp. Mi166|nr:hypothetical protein C0995_000203 [Termitomyces sp. Mi166\
MDAPAILDPPPRARTPEPRSRENEYRRSIGCPLKRLSSSASIQREAEMEAFLTFELEGRPVPPSRELDWDARLERSLSVSPGKGASTSPSSSPPKSPHTQTRGGARPLKVALEQYEVFSAIDKKDLDLLGEFRDRAFHLLLERQVGGHTPMVYAMQYGLPYQEVVLFLVGAVSQWINRLTDADFSKPETVKLLKLARANLKFAIDEGLAKLQTGLIASFLQTLVMCEGDGWIRDQITTISHALKAGATGKPVEVAGAVVRRFCTTSLKNAELIADVEDYIANATSDLLMMAAWSMALAGIEGGELIPVRDQFYIRLVVLIHEPKLYYFARDDRVYNAFVEKLDQHSVAIRAMPNPRLRRQLEALRTELQGRMLSARLKVERLRDVLEAKGDMRMHF